MAKPAKTKLEREYHDYLAGKLCRACGDFGVVIHHPRNLFGSNIGMGKRADHYLGVPLCPSCHVGKGGIHDDPSVFAMRWGNETELLAAVVKELWADYQKLKREKYK